MLNFFVTGTDTEVGKTTVSVKLLAHYNRQGLRTSALKPIASGCENTPHGLRNSDALQLQAAASLQFPYTAVNPYAIEPAIAPHIILNDQIKVDDVIAKCQTILSADKDVLIVEGAGGWYAPLNSQQSFADIAKQLGFAVILVVGIRLGCINHSLLSYEAILRSGLPTAGWIANCLDNQMACIDDNITAIAERLPIPLLATLPYHGELSNLHPILLR